jgi:hypothetical protein
MYCHERRQEVRTLCDDRIRSALAEHKIELRSFKDLASTHAADAATATAETLSPVESI